MHTKHMSSILGFENNLIMKDWSEATVYVHALVHFFLVYIMNYIVSFQHSF